MAAQVRLEGYALHAGTRCAVTLTRHQGPITFVQGGRRAALDALAVARSDLGVTVTDGGGLAIDLVEHLLAALGGMSVRRGVLATVEGPELPLLDGGARAFADALRDLDLPPEPAALVVARSGKVEHEGSTYELEPAEDTAITVETRFAHPALGVQRARWDGSAEAFRDRIATARTFGFVERAAELWSSGRARLAEAAARSTEGPISSDDTADSADRALRRAVLLFDAVGFAGAPAVPPPREHEIAEHKLLDLIGDLAFYGGPPAGHVFAVRPGHTATHHVVGKALALGILARR